MYNHIIDFLKENIKDPSVFTKKLFYTKDYPALAKEILDEEIVITHAIPFSEYQSAYENTKRYLAEDEVFPFLNTLGGDLICIGYGAKNENLIYYFDIEFGLFQLGNDNFYQFSQKLKPANYDWL